MGAVMWGMASSAAASQMLARSKQAVQRAHLVAAQRPQ